LLGIGTELDELLSGVSQFVEAEIERRTIAHDVPLTPADLAVITDAASELGLLDSEPDGIGLWAAETTDGAAFSAHALRVLARASTAAALHLHNVALARLAAQPYPDGPPSGNSTLALTGRLGIGGASLGRWLGGHALTGSDESTLDDIYGSGPRLRWSVEPGAMWLAPRFTDGAMELAWFRGAGKPDLAPHGPDGLIALSQSASEADRTEAINPEQFSRLLSAQQLGLVAIAQGAADVAVHRAAEYAASRRQGGQTIVAHDAVALMVADQATAVRAVEAHLAATLGSGQAVDLPAVLALRRSSTPALCSAVDVAVQIHGGSGYMRDTGVEHLLRDVNALRAMGGSPDDLGLLLAALLTPQASLHEAPESARQIAGHVEPTASLAPQPGFRRHPIMRVMSSYQTQDGWERDTRELPPALRKYRREMRQFAATELEPLALRLDLEKRDVDASPAELPALLRTAARAGLFSDLLPRPIGSVGPNRYRSSLVLQQVLKTEELARADGGLMLYLSAHNLGLAPALFSGNRHAYRDVILPALRACANGDPQIFAFAITEPGAGSDAEHGHGAAQTRPGLVATRAGGGWTLHGNKIFISGGDIARWVVAFAAIEDEGFESWTAFLVDTESSGFTRLRNEHKMGMRASGATALAFDGCFVPDELVLGGLRGGWALNRATLNFSRLPVASMSVGFAQRATEIATEFACHERLAGRPLIDRQHVQLALADMQAETSAIRSLVWQFSQRRVPEQAKASLAKFHAGDRAQVVIERAIGLLGEHGLLHQTGLEKVFRDNRLTRIFEGTNQINRLSVIEDQQQLLLAETLRRPTVNSSERPSQ
jgi:alkylation response protein AidB-like acyl-CoA dehydrogenase